MEYIEINKDSLSKEHICCAIAKEDDVKVMTKKAYLGRMLDKGLVFRKADARGKCFIEYLPSDASLFPVNAPGYMHISCFWVSGSLKGHGYGRELLEACIMDAKAKGYSGLTCISSDKKKPFLSDPVFLKKHGFIIADRAEPYFTLMYLPFADDAPKPSFSHASICENGFVLVYSDACPYTAEYVPEIVKFFRDRNTELKIRKIESHEDALCSPAVWTTWSLFKDGKLITHEILNGKKAEKLLKEYF
ncbi:MAG: GNAT family N-acetyltransferase [Bullifex sp.]